MRILVLGGTGWLGGAVARVALARGHEVTCLARGSSAVPAGVTWVHADRDADDALEPVIRDDWDAVIDVSRTPQHVRRAARDLAGRVGRAVFVSTASVYADQATPGAAEALARNDAHSYFARAGAQVVTGPTLTNVNDFRAILILPPDAMDAAGSGAGR